jgi:DNA-binding beta-propeller fold protein YncE
VYVVDKDNQRIEKFDSNGKFITKWGSVGSGNGQFNEAQDIAIDSAGHVYVTDRGNNNVQVFAHTS